MSPETFVNIRVGFWPIDPVPGVTITFQLRDENGLKGSAPGFAGSFSPAQGVTNANGELDTQLIPDVADCTINCSTPNDCDSTTSIVAVDSTGLFESVPLVLLDAVP